MTTHAAPYLFSSMQGDLGRAYEFAAQEILLELQDRLDILAAGVAQLVGDFAGTGTDTLRITRMGGVGFSASMVELSSETQPIPRSTITTGYTEVAMGMYGIAHSNSYKHMLLSREPQVLLDAIKRYLPDSWSRQFRKMYCATGATFTDSIGDATSKLTVDDWLDLIAKYNEREGSGRPTATLHGKQLTQLLESFRTEPSFQASVQGFTDLQALNQAQRFVNFAGLGIDVLKTSDVNTSGGGHVGFAHDPGGIGYAVANTSALQGRTANPQESMVIPSLGLLIEGQTEGSGQAISAYEARSFKGMAKGASEVYTQTRILSIAA